MSDFICRQKTSKTQCPSPKNSFSYTFQLIEESVPKAEDWGHSFCKKEKHSLCNKENDREKSFFLLSQSSF